MKTPRLAFAALATLAFAQIAHADSFDRANSKYCQQNTFDPLCMDEKMLGMRKQILAMDDKAVMDQRTKYCQDNSSDSACQPDIMKSAGPVKGFDRAGSKYCQDNSVDPVCMDDAMFEMRKKVVSMDKKAIMDNRSKYCQDNSSDSACQPDNMKNENGF